MSTRDSWNLVVKSELPADCTSFDIEIIGTGPGQEQAFRLESVHLNTNEIMAKANNEQRLSLNLDMKSVDGVLCFLLTANFSFGPTRIVNDETGFPFNDRTIECTLARLLSPATNHQLDSNVLHNLHRSIQLLPNTHSMRSQFLAGMGDIYFLLFRRSQYLDALNKAVDIYQEAILNATTQRHIYATKYGNALRDRFERLGDLNDINKSISLAEDAIRLTPDGHPDHSSLLNNLGASLIRRFEHSGDPNDINKGISVAEEATQFILDGHPRKPSWLNNLGASLCRRFEHFGDPGDINKAILVAKEAVRLTPDDHPDKHSRLNNLGNSLLYRFEHLGDLSYINNAISVTEEAVQLTPDGHPEKASHLNNLGNSLSRRFQHLGDLSDLNKAISVAEEAMQLTPDGHPAKPSWLNSLGTSLSRRFGHLNDPSDINKAISVAEEAVRLTPDGHPDKPSRLNNLGNSLARRFEHLGDLSNINNAILAAEEAVRLTLDSHPHKPSQLSNLGHSLCCRFEHLGDPSDINKAISVAQDAVQLTPDGYPEKSSWLNNLGIVLFCRFEHLRDPSDINRAILVFKEAAKSPTGSTFIRFQACFLWAKCCQLYDRSSSILDAYHRAFELLPVMVWLGLSISDRQHFLQWVGPLVDEAVSAAVDANQFETALEWTDQGHSVVWGQLLQLRTPVDDLRQHHLDLADKLTIISKKLEGAGTRDNFRSTFNDLPSTSTEKYHELVDERDKLLQHIRGLDGFDQFLLPRTFSQLRMAARNGPAICINVSKRRCDALILMPGLDNILHVPLAEFTHKTAEAMYRNLRQLFERHGRNISYGIDSKPRNVHHNDSGAEAILKRLLSRTSTVCHEERGIEFKDSFSIPETVFQSILAHLWRTVVKPILDRLGFSDKQPEEGLVRVWWCTSGLLSFLPVHAAGIYGEKVSSRSKLADFVVSSYTPTLLSLITDSRSVTLSNGQVLAVALPMESHLPGARLELDCITKRVGSSNVRKLVESEATLENVIAGLEESSFVHFACHGVQDATSPHNSALLLANSSRLTLSHLHRLSLPHARLAFLSACQTATGDERLVQESVHLAAGMLSVGYQGVIGTMWSIMDGDAPVVADEVYAHLFKDSELDPTQAALALHKAIQKLIKDSDGTKSFLEWVPFIHIGI